MRKKIVWLLYIIFCVIIISIIEKYFPNLSTNVVLLIGVILGIVYATVYWNWADVMDKKDKDNRDK